ncbi:MAG: DUF3306 domain-containing protein [Pseudomonadota bacterium]
MTPSGPHRPDDFWSRRKAAVAEEARAETQADAEARAAEARAELEAKSDDEILETLGLEDPDAMEQGDDFSAFLKAEVPERLRRRALRRLWRTNPVLANLDALVDYGEDFTDAATVVEDLQTAYRVGKGMLAHIERQLKDAEEADASNALSPDALQPDATPSSPDNAPSSENAAPQDETVDVTEENPAQEPQVPARTQAEGEGLAPAEPGPERGAPDALPQSDSFPSPRRMRFVYGGTPKEVP